jgi:hypothetical protein
MNKLEDFSIQQPLLPMAEQIYIYISGALMYY